jgi:hypothetical protein
MCTFSVAENQRGLLPVALDCLFIECLGLYACLGS